MKEKLQEYALVAEIISAVAVVAGLIFVGLEVRQGAEETAANTAATQGVIRNRIIDSDVTLLTSPTSARAGVNLYKKEELSDYEASEVLQFLTAVVRTREHQWVQFQNGLLDERTFRSNLSALFVTLSTPRGRKYWNAASTGFDEQFVAEIENNLPAPTEISMMESLNNLMK